MFHLNSIPTISTNRHENKKQQQHNGKKGAKKYTLWDHVKSIAFGLSIQNCFHPATNSMCFVIHLYAYENSLVNKHNTMWSKITQTFFLSISLVLAVSFGWCIRQTGPKQTNWIAMGHLKENHRKIYGEHRNGRIVHSRPHPITFGCYMHIVCAGSRCGDYVSWSMFNNHSKHTMLFVWMLHRWARWLIVNKAIFYFL